MVRDPSSGKYRRTRLFVLVLGYSRKAVRLLTLGSSVRIWAELHERAFQSLGGAPRTIVLDNLREGVLVPDLYDPRANPLYRDVLAHYGAVALPCRVRDPDRKGKVESGVGHAKRTALAGLRFESLAAAQAHLDHWEERWADTRIHGTTKRQVAAMFAEERGALLPLPLAPFRYYQHGARTVHLDGCVEVEAAYYSAPPGWIGRVVAVQWDTLRVRLLDPKTSELLREHVKSERGRHRIHDDDRSPRTPPPGWFNLLLVEALGCRQESDDAGGSWRIVSPRRPCRPEQRQQESDEDPDRQHSTSDYSVGPRCSFLSTRANLSSSKESSSHAFTPTRPRRHTFDARTRSKSAGDKSVPLKRSSKVPRSASARRNARISPFCCSAMAC